MAKDTFYKQPTMPGVPRKPVKGSASSQEKIPKKIGPYKIEGLLDKGGMSLLYLGSHPETHEALTVKVLSPEYLSEPEMVQRFLKEAEIIAMADHPNIVRLYGNGKWEKGLYIAMEFIQGISLKHFITHEAMSLKRALEITLDVAYALCHLHTHGVIHRDLKPENILITQAGHVKVIDFGIAQMLTEQESERITKRRRLMGTPIYMSPEQRENPKEVSFPSDIYSLAIICYELILGKLSHGIVQLSLMPKGLQPILAKALNPKPQDRYQDIVDFITDISNYLNSTELTKERKGSDRAADLMGTMHTAQQALLPAKHPPWEDLKVGLVTHKVGQTSGIYYDFFDLPEKAYGIIMAEPEERGPEGLVYTAVLRGMVRTMAHLTKDPAELLSILNELVCKDPISQVYRLILLVLEPQKNALSYCSCGYGLLWMLPDGSKKTLRLEASNPEIGRSEKSDYRAFSHSWGVDDQLLLTNFGDLNPPKRGSPNFSEADLQQAILALRNESPQKLVDGLYRRMVTQAKEAVADRPVSMISILREG